MSFFDRQSISETIFIQRKTPNQAPESGSEDVIKDFDLDVKLLQSYSFLSAVTAQSFTMHALVQFTTRKWLQARSEGEFWNNRFVRGLNAAFPENIGYKNWSSCATLFPHVKAAQSSKPMDESTSKIWASLLYRCASYAFRRGLEADAHTMANLSVDEIIELEGQESDLAFRGMLLLSELTIGHPSPTIEGCLQAQVVEISKIIYGGDTLETMDAKRLLANFYLRRGRCKEAENIQVEVMETSRQLLGDEDQNTLDNVGDLVATYYIQHSYEKAADLGERLLQSRHRTLRPRDH
jgi:hypothetical protein